MSWYWLPRTMLWLCTSLSHLSAARRYLAWRESSFRRRWCRWYFASVSSDVSTPPPSSRFPPSSVLSRCSPRHASTRYVAVRGSSGVPSSSIGFWVRLRERKRFGRPGARILSQRHPIRQHTVVVVTAVEVKVHGGSPRLSPGASSQRRNRLVRKTASHLLERGARCARCRPKTGTARIRQRPPCARRANRTSRAYAFPSWSQGPV